VISHASPKYHGFGIGSILVEIMKDGSFQIAPITEFDTDEMVHAIKGFPLLNVYRGAPKADLAAVKCHVLGFTREAAERAADLYTQAQGRGIPIKSKRKMVKSLALPSSMEFLRSLLVKQLTFHASGILPVYISGVARVMMRKAHNELNRRTATGVSSASFFRVANTRSGTK
jgi:hypothetical protein